MEHGQRVTMREWQNQTLQTDFSPNFPFPFTCGEKVKEGG